MPTIRVYGDEFYPVYYEDDYVGNKEIEVTDEELTFIRRASKKFWASQELIEQKLKEAND
jgi:hypothetical protein